GRALLEASEIAAKRTESLLDPAAKVSPERAGVTLLGRAREESAAADAKLAQGLKARQTELGSGLVQRSEAFQATRAGLEAAEKDARDAAQRMIDVGFTDIQHDIDQAMAVAKAGHNSGELWWAVGEKIRSFRQGIMSRAKKMYGEADMLAGDNRPNIT